MSNRPDLSSRRSLRDLEREAGLLVDGNDLMIRSVSTILRWMQHTTDVPTGQPQERPERGHFLDRVALTFVPGTRPADVAAVIYWDKANSRLLVDAIPGEHGFDVVRNSPLLERGELASASDNDEATHLLRVDMYKFFYERGVDVISVDMHASRMQSLLYDVHHAKNARPDTKTARRNLRHYIYMYCACGIWQRLTARAPRFGHQIVHFFLAKNGDDLLLDKEAFDVKSRISPASHVLDQDETWLKELLCGFDQTATVEYKLEKAHVGNSKVVYHLVLNEDVLWNLYMFAAACIRHIRRSTLGIRTWIRIPQPGRKLSKKNRQGMEAMLDEMHSALYRLYKLLHHSPSFWRLVDLLGIISLEKLEDLKERSGFDGKGVANETRPPGSSSSTYAYASSTHSPSSPVDIISRRHGFKYKEHRHARLPEDYLVHTFSDIVRGWLQSITRWYHAVQDLSNNESIRAAVQHGFVVGTTTPASPHLPHRQRSLVSTLWSLRQPRKWSVEQARDAIKARATELVQAMELQTQEEAIAMDAKTGKAVPQLIHDRQLKALKILADFSEEAIQEWEEAFEGCVHCEGDLACRMYFDDRNICEELIGVSKRCCFCCDSALLAFYPHLKRVSSHGKVYHWAPPPGTPGFVKESVLFNLKVEFDRFVRCYLNPNEVDKSRSLTSDSSRESDLGSTCSSNPSSVVDSTA
ncbi:hypothetical protein M407DRAFT_244980 [Tulasnella calospora MUT 4182]|uniref:Uncharacterized protein n=1 Tax=Tulasnella calospora MUT 4182 TaxID=1051891 RepID=A0A0C3LNI6_9AGAM|nr:hypothetical protein M407DRAFT_244980 [Tulasnella calospora MUT 4182]